MQNNVSTAWRTVCNRIALRSILEGGGTVPCQVDSLKNEKLLVLNGLLFVVFCDSQVISLNWNKFSSEIVDPLLDLNFQFR